MRKAAGSLQTSIDPRMSEWGNPAKITWSSCTEYIGAAKRTWRTETSKYPEEQKSTEIPLVAASERGLALKHIIT
jgi:hypothetical protein